MFQVLRRWRRQPTPRDHATPRQPLAEYNTRDAHDRFSDLVRRARRGEEIVIAHAGRPVAKLVPYNGEARRPGIVRTRIVVGRDRIGRQTWLT